MRRDFPKAPAPRHRSRYGTRSSRRSGGVALPLIIFAAAVLLCGGFWLFAIRSLEDLPAREAIQRATAEAAGNVPRREPIVVGTPTVDTSGVERAASGPSGAAPSDGVAEPQGDVRYVEKAGIVAQRAEGPLVREAQVYEPPPPRAPKPERYRLVVIESAGVIDARTHTIDLAHIVGTPAGESCTGEDGRSWPCGARARTALRRLVRRRAIECRELAAVASESSRRTEDCTVAGTNLSEWLVEQGWARPSDDAPDGLKSLAEAAMERRVGLYQANGR